MLPLCSNQLKMGFLERDFERDHLAEKATGQKWAKKYTAV
jgi:hypothetical protein